MEDRCYLYLITPPVIDDLDAFAARLAAALDAGPVACVQLRLKGAADDAVLTAAATLMPLCHDRDVAFLINDRADLASKAGADGVHLGQGDGNIAEARTLLGHDLSIGVTCHDSVHLGYEAGEAGADYVAFGAFYDTGTKAVSHRPDPEILTAWAAATELPSVAIGGITPENCAPLVRAGADFLAVCSGVWDHPAGPAAAVQAFEAAITAATA